MDELREVFRKGRYAQCQFMTRWKTKPPRFIHVYEPDKREEFVAAQRMGCWAEVDVAEVVARLNGDWPLHTTDEPDTDFENDARAILDRTFGKSAVMPIQIEQAADRLNDIATAHLKAARRAGYEAGVAEVERNTRQAEKPVSMKNCMCYGANTPELENSCACQGIEVPSAADIEQVAIAICWERAPEGIKTSMCPTRAWRVTTKVHQQGIRAEAKAAIMTMQKLGYSRPAHKPATA